MGDDAGDLDAAGLEVDDQARVVRLIFNKYRDGWSPAAIAGWLTENNHPSPRAGKKHKYNGWGDSTVRGILSNEKYIGDWTYNETEWRLHPVTRKRVPRRRNPNEVEHDHREELRIVDEELWTAVRTRMDSVSASWREGKPKGSVRRNRTAKRNDYPLSGLLVCACCAKPMTLQGGTSAIYYKCNSYKRTRGKACPNGRSVREAQVREGLLDLIREKIATPGAIAYVRDQVSKRLAAIARTGDADLIAAERVRRTPPGLICEAPEALRDASGMTSRNRTSCPVDGRFGQMPALNRRLGAARIMRVLQE